LNGHVFWMNKAEGGDIAIAAQKWDFIAEVEVRGPQPHNLVAIPNDVQRLGEGRLEVSPNE
jgi:hypothetical protein